MTKLIIAAAMAISATAAFADNDSGSFAGFSGAFEGGVSAMSTANGNSFTSSAGGWESTSIRNESGAGQFSGAAVGWEGSLVDRGVTMTAETFADGFDYSNTIAGGGIGEGFASRLGTASAGGSFSAMFGSFETAGDWDDMPSFGGKDDNGSKNNNDSKDRD